MLKHRRNSTASPVLFPMYVLSTRNFLELDINANFGKKVPAHQALLKQGLLTKWEPWMQLGSVSFVSHQWLAWDAADPDFEQLEVLKRVIQRIIEGDITSFRESWVDAMHGSSEYSSPSRCELLDWAKNGYIWFDYFSIPQTVGYDVDAGVDLMNAVDSIPAYVEMCKHFFVLCPPLLHKNKASTLDLGINNLLPDKAVTDYGSWSSRGWCRAEACARLLARNTGPMIKIDSAEGTPSILLTEHAWFTSAGDGEFTCCERQHRFPRKDPATGQEVMVDVPCDRRKVASVVHLLINKKQATLSDSLSRCESQASGERRRVLFEKRWIESVRAYMLAGLEKEQEKPERDGEWEKEKCDDAFANFMERFHFDVSEVNGTALDHKSGWTPLRFAAASNDSLAVRALLEKRADPNAPLLHGAFAHRPGAPILHTAVKFGGEAVVRLLLDHGAKVSATTKFQDTALHVAAIRQNIPVLRWLVENEPEMLESSCHMGNTPLELGLFFGNGAQAGLFASELLRLGAQPERSGNGGISSLMCAAMAERDQGKGITMLLQTCPSLDVDKKISVSWWDKGFILRLFWLFSRTMLWVNRLLGLQNSALVHFFGHGCNGFTPLQHAALIGSVPAMQVLLKHGADPLLQNDDGRTARDLARIYGPYPLVERLLVAAEEQASRQRSAEEPWR